MARRDALRELQSRLAERLQAARTETARRSWLAVDCAGLGMLMPLETAGEIFALSPLMAVPHTQPWFLGVANLRGQLHGVVDLAAFLGLRPPQAPDALREQSQIVAFNPRSGAHCAVLVDRLAGLRSEDQLTADEDDEDNRSADSIGHADGANGAQTAQTLRPAAVRPAFATARWRDTAGRHWQEIDLLALAHHPRFRSIAT
ncbi:MAG: chemotaxis protein CheW [Rubrivivax sp.]